MTSRLLVGAAAVVALAVGIWVCAEIRRDTPPDTVLRALQADPMAARHFPGTRLVTTEDQSARRSDVLTGKPRMTQVLRAFAPIAGRSLDAVQQMLVKQANSAGWAISIAADGSARGTITLQFGRADLIIAVNHYLTPPAITVTLAPANPNL